MNFKGTNKKSLEAVDASKICITPVLGETLWKRRYLSESTPLIKA